jgi:enoyl-CoA hydratase/carnithine racemase
MTVDIQRLGSARVIVWDRQARLNAWDLDTMTEIADAIEACGADEAARCVVVRGAGGNFSAGDDLFAALEATKDSWAATIEGFQRLTRVVLAAPLPVIAALDGAVVGGALEFAASCDLRIGTPRLRLMTPEVTIGFVMSNAGTLFLPSVLGESAARELLLTGQMRDARWAQANRFVSEVVDDLDEALERFSAAFDGTSREAVARTKAMLNARFGSMLQTAMEREADECVDLFDHPDSRTALQGFAARSESRRTS